MPGFITAQGVALADGSPAAGSVNAVFKTNPAIKTAFGGSTAILGMGELGGAYDLGGSGTQSTSSIITFGVTLTPADLAHDLVIGLYGGSATGSGVTGVTLDVWANGTDVLHQSFASAASATAYFTNNTADLGAITGSEGSPLTLQVVLGVTTNAPGSGFIGGVLLTG